MAPRAGSDLFLDKLGTRQLNPELPLKIGILNEREAPQNGLRLKA
jgi:hypothetical protein